MEQTREAENEIINNMRTEKMVETISVVQNMLGTYNNIIIRTPTGTGKSLKLPMNLWQYGKVFIVQPKKIAAKNIADKLKRDIIKDNKYRSIRDVIKVGSAYEGEINYDEISNMVYVTADHLKTKIYESYQTKGHLFMDFADIIILDDAHENTISYSVIILMMEYGRSVGYKIPKLILMSASSMMHIKEVQAIVPPPFVYEVKVPTYEIDIIYEKPSSNWIDGLFKVVVKALDNAKDQESVLVFLPGKASIDKMDNLAQGLPLNIEVILVTSKTMQIRGNKTQDTALVEILLTRLPEEGKKRVIISTNIAESSITIAHLTSVIDSMKENISNVTETGSRFLNTEFISKTSAEQRTGRVGRTAKGTCYRYITRENYEKLEPYKTGEIHRLPVENVISEMSKYGIPFDQVLITHEPDLINDAVNNLGKNGILDIGDGNTFKLTSQGDSYMKLSIIPVNNKVIWRSKENNFNPNEMFAVAVVVSIIENYGPYFEKPAGPPESLQKVKDKYKMDNDLEVYLKIMRDFLKKFKEFDETRLLNPKARNFLKKNHLIEYKFRYIIKKILRIITYLYDEEKAAESIRWSFIDADSENYIIPKLKPILAEVYGTVNMPQRISNMSINRYKEIRPSKIIVFSKYRDYITLSMNI